MFELFIFQALVSVALCAALLWSHRRSSRRHRELAQALHDRALAADQRADALQTQLDTLALGQRFHHARHLVALSRGRGLLSEAASSRLHGHLHALRQRSEA